MRQRQTHTYTHTYMCVSFTTFYEHCVRLQLYDARFIGMRSGSWASSQDICSGSMWHWVPDSQLPVGSAVSLCHCCASRVLCPRPEPGKRGMQSEAAAEGEGVATARLLASPIHICTHHLQYLNVIRSIVRNSHLIGLHAVQLICPAICELTANLNKF